MLGLVLGVDLNMYNIPLIFFLLRFCFLLIWRFLINCVEIHEIVFLNSNIITLLTPEELRLVAINRGAEPSRIALSIKAAADVRPSVVAQQVDAYNRLVAKVPSWAKHEGLQFPFPVAIQQCSSEPLARFRQNLIEGDSLVDLTGGLGVDCFFMGQGMSRAVYVDASPDAVDAARHNFGVLGASNTDFVCSTAEEFLENSEASSVKFDNIFIDPSRRSSSGGRVFKLEDCSPDVTTIAPLMLRVADTVYIKLSPLLDISQVISRLPCVSDVYAIGHASECKDLLVVLKAGLDVHSEPVIHAQMLSDDGGPVSPVSYCAGEEKRCVTRMAERLPSVGEKLFVPSPAVMKAAPFSLLTNLYDVEMLGCGTHVYVGHKDITDFPGRRFEIVAVYDLSKRSIGELRKAFPSAAVAVRNFPMSADELRKKLKIGESSMIFLFGVSAYGGKQLLLVCHKLS